ncbi:MAG: FG-GAP repeat protein, partial [bacterium]|nr:FG-GAP repeat protein [bacterium]
MISTSLFRINYKNVFTAFVSVLIFFSSFLFFAPPAEASFFSDSVDVIVKSLERIGSVFEGFKNTIGQISSRSQLSAVVVADSPGTISADNLNGTKGFRLRGASSGPGTNDHGGFAGTSVAGGDINGDGLGDIVIGEPEGEPFGVSGLNNSDRGQTHIVFGTRNVSGLSGVTTTGFDLRTLNGVNGFSINGQRLGTPEKTGSSVATGDINSDGRLDVLIGNHPNASDVARAFGV